MNSENQNYNFEEWTIEWTNSYLKCREGEVKIGEEFCALNDAKYVVLGIKESIGPQANLGRPGAENAFEPFCDKFFNLQSNRFLNGKNIAFLGQIEMTEGFHEPEYRLAVAELDEFVVKVLSEFLSDGQIPVVIGGGHNNAYPLIRYISERYGTKINIVNLDAHADYRRLEGRHSGNPFSYAFDNGYVDNYSVIGLHQSYNSEENLKRLDEDGHKYVFMEDFIDGKEKWVSYIQEVKEMIHTENKITGMELDLDVIQMMPSSASSPFGCDFIQARQYVRTLVQTGLMKYFHIPEGAPIEELERNQVGKALALLVSDFVGAQINYEAGN